VIYVNGKNIVNGATNTVAIYTAAEIAFNTQVGTTYTIQGISALTGSWSEHQHQHPRHRRQHQLSDAHPEQCADVLPRGSHAVITD
jgi:hypothetical protein